MEKQARTARALLTHLVCPITKGPLDYDAQNQRLISQQIKKAFPIRSGVPMLLIEEAQDINSGDAKREDRRDKASSQKEAYDE